MEVGPQNHNGDGLLRPNSVIVVYMDPLGMMFRVLGIWLLSINFDSGLTYVKSKKQGLGFRV